MLLLQNLLNPDYGMIKEDDESNLSWFRDSDDNSEITLRYIKLDFKGRLTSKRHPKSHKIL